MGAPKVSIPDHIARASDISVESGRPMVLRAYGFIPITEAFIRDFVKKVLGKYNRPELASAVGLILKELTVNAAKANFKKIMFQEHSLDMEKAEDYERGMQIFRASVSESMAHSYGIKSRDARLSVVTKIFFGADRMIIEVRNNLPMSKDEDRRVRLKMKQAMECENIAEFIMENIDETEGAGLGILMCMSALKSSAIDPRALTISTNYENETVARVEIPLRAAPKAQTSQNSSNN